PALTPGYALLRQEDAEILMAQVALGDRLAVRLELRQIPALARPAALDFIGLAFVTLGFIGWDLIRHVFLPPRIQSGGLWRRAGEDCRDRRRQRWPDRTRAPSCPGRPARAPGVLPAQAPENAGAPGPGCRRSALRRKGRSPGLPPPRGSREHPSL